MRNGHFRHGFHGLILVDNLRGENVFRGYLAPDYLTRLDRLGLRPIGAPSRRLPTSGSIHLPVKRRQVALVDCD